MCMNIAFNILIFLFICYIFVLFQFILVVNLNTIFGQYQTSDRVIFYPRTDIRPFITFFCCFWLAQVELF